MKPRYEGDKRGKRQGEMRDKIAGKEIEERMTDSGEGENERKKTVQRF